MKILVLNSGSSSQKCCLYETLAPLPVAPPARLWDGKVDWSDDVDAVVTIVAGQSPPRKQKLQLPSRRDAIERLLKSLWEGSDPVLRDRSEIQCVGHRVVHGGPDHLEPEVVTPAVREAITQVSAFAPLHNRAELEGMAIIESLLGSVRQVAVFDTGFHRQIPLAAKVYPGPYEWFSEGIRRYGFHGINHQYCAERVAELLQRDLSSLRIVTCHIGNGCSLAAIQGGHSVDTTMGFTPLEGLMMGTRSGSVDPGILTYLMRSRSLTGKELDALLNRQSGLLGISGLSGDVREIEQAVSAGHERARLAWDMYIHRLIAGIGAMAAVMGGMDALCFSAGVGENSSELRRLVCERLAFLGMQLDVNANLNLRGDRVISSATSATQVLVIAAQEEWQIARECYRLSERS